MSEFKAKIIIENDQREFYFGDTIKGKVFIDVKEKIDLKVLELNLIWFTKGKGGKDSEKVFADPIVLDGETSLEEGSYPYDFEIVIPVNDSLPQTYLGNILSINWAVNINIDIKNKNINNIFQNENFDEIIKVNKIESKNIIKECNDCKTLDTTLIFLKFIGLISLCISFLIFTELIESFKEIKRGDIIFLSITNFIVITISFFSFKYYFKFKKANNQKELLGEIILDYSKEYFEDLNFKLKVNPIKKVEIKEITWKLTIEEKSNFGSGKNKTNYNYNLYEREENQSILKTLEEGKENIFDVNFILGNRFPTSFDKKNNFIEWKLEIKVNDIMFKNYKLIVV